LVTRTWSYSYDTLNRLSTGSQTAAGSQALSSLPNLCWNYDAFGNRLQQYGASLAFESGSGGPNACQPQSSGTVSTALASFDGNNRMTSTNERGVTAQVLYDASGNVTWDGVNYYLYDAESRICAVASTAAGTPIMTGYMYDADGIRVSKGTIQQWSCNPTTAQYATQTDYILGPGGEQMSEYAMQPGNTMAWVHTNVWAAGRLLATYAQDSSSTTQQGLIHFYFDDPLGSRRAQTDYAGNLEQNCGNLPYGDGETCGPTPTEHLFTGKERDAESGNDYFEARYFGSSMGRFLSPDPLGGDLTNPQSLNRYSYVLNNPLTNTDPTGLYTCTDSKDCSSKKDQALEKTLAGLRNSKNADVARGANAYGAANSDNGVSVGFKDLSGSGKGGDTVSTVGTDADGNLRANSAITINSKDSGTDFTADVGHEGSHAADAQDVVKSGLENGDKTIHAGMNITPYQSEQTLRHFIRHSAAKAIALPCARRQVAAHHAVPQLAVEQLARRRVRATTPGTDAIFGIAANMEIEERSQNAETVIYRACASCLRRGSRCHRAMRLALTEVCDIPAYGLPRHPLRLDAVRVEPCEEVRQTECIRPLRVHGTIPQPELKKELIAQRHDSTVTIVDAEMRPGLI